MKLYHGSTQSIERIDLSCSKPNKDFGSGFYLSDNEQQAMKLAQYKAEQLDIDPVVNIYEFDESLLLQSDLSVKKFSGYTKDWAQFVFDNRNSSDGGSVHSYDIVIGPIANDRVGLQIRRYIEQEITFDVFIERLKYMKGITFQYFFGTERAINQLIKI